MEIKKKDFEQQIDLNHLLSVLIEKYYPEYDEYSFGELDVVTQTFILLADADGQINNGGIIQFIDNETGNRFHETFDAARRINSEICIALFTISAEQFPNGKVPKDWEERRSLYEQLCDENITYKTFDELSSEEKEIVLENRKKYDDTTPLDQCSYEQKSTWSDTWEELDTLYFDNTNLIYQDLIDYLKKNAKLID